jgi:chemosensory pili system protein ChpA (sensor histidine kinase/response regulator)
VVAITSESLVTEENSFAVRLQDGAEVPLHPMDNVLSLTRANRVKSEACVVVRASGQRRAFILEKPGREDELFVKPLGRPLRQLPLYLGGAVLENGSLALVLDPGELVARAGGTDTARASQARVTRRGKVLLVDDSPLLRGIFSDIIEGLGHEVRVAEDGMLALEQLEGYTPDVVFTDLDMPRMDGFELIQKLREKPRVGKVPVVVLSSRAGSEDRNRAMRLGANAYLIKNETHDHGISEALRSFLP